MPAFTFEQIEELREKWTDQMVVANPQQPELLRFGSWVGRVVTVNCSGKLIVDFGDGGWYDFNADALVVLDPTDKRRELYNSTGNSAQPNPPRQA
jgi:hypothetical protein